MIAVFWISASISAETESQTDPASALAHEVFQRIDGQDQVSSAQMELVLQGGNQRSRSLFIYQRDTPDGGEKTLIRFSLPGNIRDTGLLVDTSSDGLWLYLPALDRVRRISSENRGGSFVQSQLYYEDLEQRLPDEDQHRLLPEGDYEGVPTQVLESTPIDPSSSVYTKRVSWIHKETLVPLRVDFYEGGDQPSKRLEVLQLEQIQGYWTVTESVITDLTRGDSTRIVVNDIRYDIGLPDSLFTTTALASPADDPVLPEQSDP